VSPRTILRSDKKAALLIHFCGRGLCGDGGGDLSLRVFACLAYCGGQPFGVAGVGLSWLRFLLVFWNRPTAANAFFFSFFLLKAVGGCGFKKGAENNHFKKYRA